MITKSKFIFMLYFIALLTIILITSSCNKENKNTSPTIAPTQSHEAAPTKNGETKPTPTIKATQTSATQTEAATQIAENTQTAANTQTAEITPNATTAATPTPTQNKYNGNTNFTETKSIIFSHPGGFYSKKFILKMTYDKKYTLRYTLDGNNPTSTSSSYRDNGIEIHDNSSETGSENKITVVKAATFLGTTQTSEIVTATYIVNEDYKDFQSYYNDIAVISISTDKKNLYGDTGIFTNFTEHGRESERLAHVEFFDSDGTAGFSIDAGLRVYGGTSRGAPQKSFKLVARKEYDAENGKFKYAMLPDSKNSEGMPVDRFDSFILRAGGNDNLFGGARNTLLRDALVHTLAGKMGNIAFQSYRPVIVYINGNYWGLYNLRDDTDNDYLEQHYNIPKDDVAIISYGHENGNWIYKIDEGTESDLNNYKNMISYIANTNMAISGNYYKACQLLDMDNFMKYIAVNVFANNRDWPHNNVKAWMYQGKWHFVLKDIDYAWGIYDLPGRTENVIAEETSHSENVLRGRAGEISAMFASLMKNETFKKQFLSLVDDMVNNYFSEKTATTLLDKMVETMSKEYHRIETNIWYNNLTNPAEGGHSVSLNYEAWLEATKTLYEYAQKRPAIFKDLVNKIYK